MMEHNFGWNDMPQDIYGRPILDVDVNLHDMMKATAETKYSRTPETKAARSNFTAHTKRMKAGFKQKLADINEKLLNLLDRSNYTRYQAQKKALLWEQLKAHVEYKDALFDFTIHTDAGVPDPAFGGSQGGWACSAPGDDSWRSAWE